MYATTVMETSFPKAWERCVKIVRESPLGFDFGGGSERKDALDSQITIILDRTAVQDVFNWTCHPSDPWSTENKISEYIKEYRAGFDASVFDYTYRDRLENGFLKHVGEIPSKHGIIDRLMRIFKDEMFEPVNQLTNLKEGLRIQIEENLPSNRNIAVIWNPALDSLSSIATPCFNEVLIRYEGNNEVSVHTLFRSHDLFSAWESNMIAILTMLYEEVIKPNGCRIKYVVEHNFSLHIYMHDMDLAWNIETIERNPQTIRQQAKYDKITNMDKYLLCC